MTRGPGARTTATTSAGPPTTATPALVVTGNNVTAYGLAVEHYQKSEVVWTGQGGTNVFFQNELPYDPPSQAAWNQSATQLGYPAFQVGDDVKTFNGYGMGSYVVFINTPATLHVSAAFQSPHAPGVQFHNVFGVWIAGSAASTLSSTASAGRPTQPTRTTPRWTCSAIPDRSRAAVGPGATIRTCCAVS